jgi:hypothetical protein
LLQPALWQIGSISALGGANVSATINAVAGMTHHMIDAMVKATANAAGNYQQFPAVSDGVSTYWAGSLWIPAGQFQDSDSFSGDAAVTTGNNVTLYFTATAANIGQLARMQGYTLNAPQNQDGQMLQVWNGPAGTGNLMAQYLLATPGGALATFTDSPDLSSDVGNQLTVTVDGAAPAQTGSGTGTLDNWLSARPSQTSLLATAYPF